MNFSKSVLAATMATVAGEKIVGKGDWCQPKSLTMSKGEMQFYGDRLRFCGEGLSCKQDGAECPNEADNITFTVGAKLEWFETNCLCAPTSTNPEPEAPNPEPEEVTVTVAPEEVTVAPEEVTVAPEEVTVAPEEVTVAPEEVTVAPEEVTVAPEEVTVAPEETVTEARGEETVPTKGKGDSCHPKSFTMSETENALYGKKLRFCGEGLSCKQDGAECPIEADRSATVGAKLDWFENNCLCVAEATSSTPSPTTPASSATTSSLLAAVLLLV